MSTDNNNNDKQEQEQLKLDALNKIFEWIEDKKPRP